MKKSLSRLLPLAVLLMVVSCTDDSYDLSDIDTESRFIVSGLTIPVNLNPIKLGQMLDIADDSDIKTDSEGNYYFRKDGNFSSGKIKVAKILFQKPDVKIDGNVDVSLNLDPEIKSNIKKYAADKTIEDILSNEPLMTLIGITADTEILTISFDAASSSRKVVFEAYGIDSNVKSIDSLGLDPALLSIKVKVNGINDAIAPFALNDMKLVLPKGLTAVTKPGTTYDPVEGTLIPDDGSFGLDDEYNADLSMSVCGLKYSLLVEKGQAFNPDDHSFKYEKECSVAGGTTLKVRDMKMTAKFADIEALEQPGKISYNCNIGFEKDIQVSSFKGDITYSMDDITVAPINISSIPDILKEAGTNIDLRNPQIYLGIKNSLGKFGVGVNASIEIKGNNTIAIPLTVRDADSTKLVMAPLKEGLLYPDGYEFEEAKDLSKVVGSSGDQTFPEKLNLRVVKPTVPRTTLAEEFELGKDYDGVGGKWEFYTRLSLTDKAKIKYSKKWDDLGSEDIDGLTVNSAKVNVTIQKDVALDADNIEFVLSGEEGELSGQTAITGDASQDVEINLSGEAVRNIKSAELNIHLKGMNKDLNKKQEVQISNLKLTIDGYFDKKL